MECSCSISVSNEGERPGIYSETMQKACKEHKCTECRRKILPGETYQRVDGLWDGNWDHFKTCGDCMSMIEIFFDARPCFGDLWEEFYGEFNYLNAVVPEKCLSALTPGARAKVCEMIEENWEDEE